MINTIHLFVDIRLTQEFIKLCLVLVLAAIQVLDIVHSTVCAMAIGDQMKTSDSSETATLPQKFLSG